MRRTSALLREPRSKKRIKGEREESERHHERRYAWYHVTMKLLFRRVGRTPEADLHKGLLNDDLNSSFIYGTEFKIH